MNSIEKENQLVCALVQASLGLITENIRVMILDMRLSPAKVVFVLGRATQDDIEAVAEMMFELEALVAPQDEFLREVVIDSSDDLSSYFSPLRGVRPVYCKREG